MQMNEIDKISLRRCTREDIHIVMDINETTLPENYPLFFYEQIIEKYPEAFTLAYLENNPKKIAGYIMWRVERGPSAFGLEYVKKGHLVSLAVLPAYRRLGVANKLLNYSMDIVRNYGVAEFVLEVRVSNTAAINLYDKANGYEKIKILSHYYRDGEDAFYMAYRNDGSGKYIPGSSGMSDKEIILFYKNQHQGYMTYRCPNCQALLLKSLNYALPGSINPNDKTMLPCPQCKFELRFYDLSQGKYDVE